MSKWSHHQAVGLCQDVEKVAIKHGYHVALTGGCLYGDAVPRKDVDILFYTIRQQKGNRKTLVKALETELGFELKTVHGWMQKATVEGRNIDMFFPETKKKQNKWFGVTKAGEEY